MLGKAILFVFAFTALVSDALAVDYSTNPGVRPLHPIRVALPDARHNLQPVALKRYDSAKFQLPYLQATARTNRDIALKLSKRQDIIDRWFSRFRTLSGINVQQKRSLRDIWFRQFRDATGINVSKRDFADFDTFGSKIRPVGARDTAADAQLQTFVSNTANLLRALGKSDAAKAFLSKVDNLKSEARNGSLEPDDLVDAARAFAASILS